MVSSACIYNPSWGDEENVEEQLVFTYGSEEVPFFIRAIGVAQGVAEFSYSFDQHPVSYIRTMQSLILVQRLEFPQNADWRDGFWLTCTMPSPESSPESLGYIIRDAYRQWRLHHGTLVKNSDTKEGKAMIRAWWTAFCTHWPAWHDLGAAAALPYIRVAPGRLNPAAVRESEVVRKDLGAKDLMVLTTGDASAIWPGNTLPLDFRVDMQYWFFECLASESDDSFGESLGFVRHLNGDTENQKSQSWVPDLGWYDSLPTLSFTSSWMPALVYDAEDQIKKEPEARFLGDTQKPFYDEMLNISYILSYRKNDRIFVLFYDNPPSIGSQTKYQVERLEIALGGANFAPSPLPRFSYILIDHHEHTLSSTFGSPVSEEDFGLHEALNALLIAPPENEVNRIMRRGSQWLYWKRINASTSVVFGKKRMEKDAPSLLGALHRETADWLENFVRSSGDQETS